MSILIKGREMPKSCAECEFFAWKRGVGQYCAINDRISFHITLDDFDVSYKRNGTCPLVLIPPHGRLIDADALLESIKEAKKKQPEISDVYDEDYFAVAEWVAYAPTIIPAEPPEAET